jgi:hypothetical protein
MIQVRIATFVQVLNFDPVECDGLAVFDPRKGQGDGLRLASHES